MKTLLIVGLSAMACVSMAQNSFYNGDADGIDGWSSQNGGSVNYSRIYEDFTLGSATTVTSLYGNFLDGSAAPAASVYWEIRSGASEGNGGTLLFSGNSAYTRVDQSQNFFGFEVWRYTVNTNFNLAAGNYWMTLAPDLSNTTGQTFIATSGTTGQAGGFITDGAALWDSNQFGVVFTNGLAQFQDGSRGEVSMGLNGTPVPEPASMAVLGAGVVALIRRRRSKKA